MQNNHSQHAKSKALHRFLNRLLEPALVAAIAVLVLVVLWQVFSRYVLQSPSTATDELARFILMWLTLLGAAWVVGQRGHLAIDILSDRLALSKAVKLQRFLVVLMALFALSVMVIGGINLVHITLTLEQSSTTLQVPMGYVYLAIPVSGVFMLGFCLCAFLEARSLIILARENDAAAMTGQAFQASKAATAKQNRAQQASDKNINHNKEDQ